MKNSFFIIFISLLVSCSSVSEKENTEILVVNLMDQESKEKESFLKLNLDQSHLNLLNPSVSKDSLEIVYKSWVKLHTDLNKFLTKKNFSWGVGKESVKLFNKIYFNKEGRIKTYAFRVFDSIPDTVVNKYKELIKEFVKGTKISIKKETDFAQCGKISLPNN